MVGVLFGGVACLLSGAREKILILENLGVGVFGAYVGGDFVAGILSRGKTNDTVFSMGSLGLAVGCAIAAMLLLQLMRRAVGPMRRSKGARRRN